MEALLFRIIALGFVLLTLTLVAACCSPRSCSASRSVHPQVVFGIALLVHLRGAAGRAPDLRLARALALRWTLAGFLALLLAYIGSKFVLEVILHR